MISHCHRLFVSGMDRMLQSALESYRLYSEGALFLARVSPHPGLDMQTVYKQLWAGC